MAEAYARFTGRLVAALEAHLASGAPVALPEGARPLWDAFCALSQARTYGAYGPNPITYPEIAAWAQLMRTPLEPHHVQAIRALDRAWLASAAGRGQPGGKQPSGTLTPELFDAMFGA